MTASQQRTQVSRSSDVSETSTASTAANEGKHVAGLATDEAKGVASEAVDQARSVVNDTVQNAAGQLGEQTRTQRDRLTGSLRSLGDDLDKMATQADSSLAGDLAREAAQRAHSISQHLDGREPGELLDDVRRFARERPGTFLLGALGAGVVAGRLLRGTKDGAEAASAGSQSGLPTQSAAPRLPATPPATSTGTAQVDPAAVTPDEAATRAGVVGYGDSDGRTLEDDLLGGRAQ